MSRSKRLGDSPTVLLGKQDADNYAAVLADWLEVQLKTEEGEEASRLKQAVITNVHRVFSMENKYVGSAIVICGPRVPRSWGSEPAYVQWIYIDKDWTEVLLKNAADFYRLASSKCEGTCRIHSFYNNGKDFELEVMFTLAGAK